MRTILRNHFTLRTMSEWEAPLETVAALLEAGGDATQLHRRFTDTEEIVCYSIVGVGVVELVTEGEQ